MLTRDPKRLLELLSHSLTRTQAHSHTHTLTIPHCKHVCVWLNWGWESVEVFFLGLILFPRALVCKPIKQQLRKELRNFSIFVFWDKNSARKLLLLNFQTTCSLFNTCLENSQKRLGKFYWYSYQKASSFYTTKNNWSQLQTSLAFMVGDRYCWNGVIIISIFFFTASFKILNHIVKD